METAPKKRGRPPGAKNKNKILEGAKEALEIARGEREPAAVYNAKAGPKPAKFTYIEDDDDDRLKVPPEIIPDGMDYQWVTDSIFGQPQAHRRARFERKGWTPVPASRHDGLFMPRGWEGEINIEGCVLMERPMEYTMMARDKDKRNAREQVRIKESQLRGGDIEGVSLDSRHQSAVRQNRINKSYERIDVPKD